MLATPSVNERNLTLCLFDSWKTILCMSTPKFDLEIIFFLQHDILTKINCFWKTEILASE